MDSYGRIWTCKDNKIVHKCPYPSILVHVSKIILSTFYSFQSMSQGMNYILIILLFLVSESLLGVEKKIVRVGFFPNLTHAQAIIGRENGWFQEKMGSDVEIQWYAYSAGPNAMEGIFTGAIDLTYVGPNPAINAYLRSEGQEVRILCGACSGGSALVVHDQGDIGSIANFKGKRISTPGLGSTQDVAARSWFKSQGFNITLTGGDVFIIPTQNPDMLMLFEKGDLDGAWTVEPWVSKLILEAKGRVYLDEKTLWPQTGGKYATTLLASSTKFLEKNADLAKKWVAAHVELTKWIRQNPGEAKSLFNKGFKKTTTKALSSQVLDRAWQNIEFTYDPLKETVFTTADNAYALGLLPHKPDLKNIYDLRFLRSLNEIEKERP